MQVQRQPVVIRIAYIDLVAVALLFALIRGPRRPRNPGGSMPTSSRKASSGRTAGRKGPPIDCPSVFRARPGLKIPSKSGPIRPTTRESLNGASKRDLAAASAFVCHAGRGSRATLMEWSNADTPSPKTETGLWSYEWPDVRLMPGATRPPARRSATPLPGDFPLACATALSPKPELIELCRRGVRP